MLKLPRDLPVVPLPNKVLLPGQTLSFVISRPEAVPLFGHLAELSQGARPKDVIVACLSYVPSIEEGNGGSREKKQQSSESDPATNTNTSTTHASTAVTVPAVDEDGDVPSATGEADAANMTSIVIKPPLNGMIDSVASNSAANIDSVKNGVYPPPTSVLHRIGCAARLRRIDRSPLSSTITTDNSGVDSANEKDAGYLVVLEGFCRLRCMSFSKHPKHGYLRSRIRLLEEQPLPVGDTHFDSLVASTKSISHELLNMYQDMHIPATVLAQIIRLIDTTPIGPLADLLVGAIEATYTERLQILDAYDINVRLMRVISLLQRQIEVLKLSRQIRSSAETKLNKKQREYYLRQQLKAIRAELGEASHSGGSNGNPLQQQQDDEYSDLIKQLDSAEMPAEVEIVAQRELKRLRRMNPAMAEHSTTRTYLEWLSEMPWNKMSTDQSDISQAKRQLDADNYGMEKAKKRIIEYMAVRRLQQLSNSTTGIVSDDNKSNADQSKERNSAVNTTTAATAATTTARSPILCLTGSPGVGKSSLGRSIAKALGRQFYRISLGGVSDEAEIRGHRRTYVGSMPGLFIQAMRRCGVRNPVILLDEIDKMGSSSHRGDPDAALLEVLDPELNNTFRDHYLGVPFDLSQVLFVATANSIHNISHALYDRLEIVDIDGYTMNEKLQIAKTYLIPKQLDLHGLGSNNTAVITQAIQSMSKIKKDGKNSNNSSDAELDSNIVDIPDESVMHIINCYTYESGVRNLERRIASVCRRKAADFVELLETTPDSIGRVRKWTSRVSVEDVDSILNVRPYDSPLAEKTAVPGVVTGLLFVTSGNGEIGFIEARKMPGKGAMHLTGMLGSVLQESAQIALSYIRDNARALGISTDDKEDIFKEIDLHIHMPAGSIRKEGPSAGITILTALVSLFLARRVSPYLAMTGELTLRGHVKAIGGVREKVLAAHRAGIKMVILPEENRKDYNKDVPEEVRKEMQATFASRAEQVLNVALNYDEDTQSIVESPIVVGLTHRL